MPIWKDIPALASNWVGSASSDLNMNGYDITCDTLDTTTPYTDLNIAASQLSGDIKIGNAKTSGSIYVGNTGNTGNTVVINAPLHVNTIESTALTITAPTMNLNGQASFDVPPHSTTPILGNDVATKDYVDSLVGQYSGGYNLYLNYSESLDSYKKLSNQVSTDTQQDVITVIHGGTEELIATFITDEINIVEIPTGLWSLTLYGAVSGAGGVLYYYFKMKKKSNGVITDLLITSGNSPDINATPIANPDAYHMSATISTPIDVALSDRIMIEIYCIKISGGNVNLNTYFEGSYYSFIQTTLNAGTTLLTSSNNWTGNNSFALSPTAPTPTVNDISTKIATTEFISTALTPYLTSSSAADTYASLNSPTFTQSITANGGILLNSPQTLSGSGSISLTGNISTPTLTSISGLNIGTTATSITIGASSIPTTINGNLTMGETGTIYTTSGQQIRLGHANTQASGTTISSFGPFFKSFGPASVSGTTYDILYEGTNGLFTPTGLNGVGGFLTIVISNKTSSEKIATLTYNVAKRVGITGIQSLTAMTHVFGGWTTIPTIGAGVGNDIRITFHAADWTNSTVSWMFMGSI